MASSAPPHRHHHHRHVQRRSWDLTHLAAKYPWLRVDAETIEEFRSPFEWVHDGDQETEDPSSESSSNDEESGRKTTRERRANAQYSLKQAGQAQRRRQHPDRRRRRTETTVKREAALTVYVSPRTTRSEADNGDAVSVVAVPTKTHIEKEVVLPTSIYADLQALKEDQRQRHKPKQKKKKPHSILSLRFPDLHKPNTHIPTASLPQQLARLHQQERALQQHVYHRIDRAKARLPLTFLFERNLDKTYCRYKCIETITSIFAKLQHRMLYYAFHQWLTLQDTQREKERREAAVKHAQTKAVALFERLASDAYVGTLARAYTKWHTTTQQLVQTEMQAAARKIQSLYRQRRAKSLLQDLKQASLDREYKRAVEIQRLLTFEAYGTAMKWRTLKNGFNLVLLSLCAKRITFFFRRIRTHKRIARRVIRTLAAVTIQCCWRRKCAWRTRQRLQLARDIQRERERIASIHLQRNARGYLARQHAALRRVQLATVHECARVVQQTWRRYGDRQQLRKRFQRRRQLLDDEKARVEAMERMNAIRRDEAKRNLMAVDIQRVVRGFLGRCDARRRRYVRNLEQATRRVQLSWRKRKGRYVLHLRFLAQRERLDHRRSACALLLQCRIRMHRAKRQRDALLRERERRRQSAISIQKIVRGRGTRLKWETTRRATVSIQSVWRGRLARDEARRQRHQRELEEQQRYHATLKLQCLARGHQARRVTRQLRSEQLRMEQLLQQSAVLIQRRARGIEARKVATLLREAMLVVDRQQRRAYAHSLQHKVNESPLLAFVMQQAIAKSEEAVEGDEKVSYSHEQLQLIRWQIDAAKQQMKREDQAVVCLQRRYRGYRTRAECVVLQLQRRERLALELRMLEKLQRLARGFLARRRVHRLRTKRRDEALKDAYIRERKCKDQERDWQDRYRHEQMALQLTRLKELETKMRDAKREAEIATWQAEAAAARKQELQDQLEAKKLERALRGQSSEDEDEEEEMEGAWAYVKDASGNGYYYNANTGESAWEKPVEARPAKETKKKEKPKKAEPAKKKEKSATKPDDTKPIAAVEEVKPTVAVPDGFCCKCKAVQADKECLDCLLPDLSLDAVYCNACFTLEHNLLSTTSRHDFKVFTPLQRPSECQHNPCLSETPARKASYYCSACPSQSRFTCEACFPRAHDTAQTSHHIPQALHFRSGALLCVECQVVLATRSCTQCDEAFCASCFDELHRHSKKDHEFVSLEILKDDLASELDAYCVDCEIRTCTKLCNLCGDGFCDACFASAHAKGQKTTHTWIAWSSFATHGDWLEILDETTRKTLYFNIETKESTHTQPFVLKSGDERHRVQFQEREAIMKKRAIELESEIIKLKEQLETVAHEKDQEIEQLTRRKRGADIENGDDAASTSVRDQGKKKGVFGRLFGSSKEPTKKTKKAVPVDLKLTPEEAKRRALQQSVAPELADINSKLKTRERVAKEEKEKRTVGTKHFEQAMLDEFVKSGGS